MNILKKLIIALAGLLVLLVGVGLLLPKTAHVERSIVVQAPAANVFTVLNGFRLFNRWSPWADIDPNAKTTFEGAETGVGAKMSWSGNGDVGTGSQEIIESTPHSSIKLRLTFGDFPGSFTATYLLAPEGTGTKVTWQFDADYGSSILGRYFGVLSDSMLGPDYEKGLARLKTFVESLPKGDFSSLNFETTTSLPNPLVLLSARSSNDANAIGVALGVAYSKLSGYVSTQGLKQTGPPVAIFYGEMKGDLVMDAGLPVDRDDLTPSKPIRVGRLYGGRVVKAVYRGAYTGLGTAREQVKAYIASAGLTQDGPLWEQYVSDPSQTPAAELQTNLYVPVK